MKGKHLESFPPPISNRGFARPDDLSYDYDRDLSDPGQFPFTRGQPVSRQGTSGWIHRELSGEGSPTRSNAQLRYLIERGAKGLDVIGDAPSVALLDPDHPFARHSVGTQGVSVCRLDDFAQLYDAIPIENVSLSHSLPAYFTVAGLFLIAKQRNIDPSVLRGSVVNAPFFVEDYAYATQLPFDVRMRLALDTIEFATEHMPKFHPFVEDTYFISDGGIGPVDEMAFGFVEIREVVRRLLERNIDIDRFAKRIVILVNCRMDLLTEIAKIRATRRIFARMMRYEFGAQDPGSWAANITVHSSGASLTAQQPINNVIRGALQAMAMAFAGVKAMEISAFDEAYRTPSDAAHMVALRTQQIVALETDISEAADPLGGSFQVERMTDDIEQRILERIHSIEAVGTASELFERGYFRQAFQEGMVNTGMSVEDGTRPVVGVNCFVLPEVEDNMLRDHTDQKIAPAYEHIEEIRAWKAGRSMAKVEAALGRVKDAAASVDNLMPVIVDAFESDATIGEITGAIRLATGLPADPLATHVTA